MWAHLIHKDVGNAQLALEQALNSAPQDTLPWVSKAELMFALQRSDEVQPAMEKAEACIRYEHDRFLMGTTYHMLGDYDRALAWMGKIDIETFKGESYRPDRAERILSRLKAEIEEEQAMGILRTAADLESGELADLIKHTLNTSVASADT
jgi:tetratricopeptide (TPR) repeat protein